MCVFFHHRDSSFAMAYTLPNQFCPHRQRFFLVVYFRGHCKLHKTKKKNTWKNNAKMIVSAEMTSSFTLPGGITTWCITATNCYGCGALSVEPPSQFCMGGSTVWLLCFESFVCICICPTRRRPYETPRTSSCDKNDLMIDKSFF